MKQQENSLCQKTALIVYLFIEAALLSLVETGKCAAWSDLTIQMFMYTAILLNAVITAFHFFNSGAYRKKDHRNLVAYAIFATAAADFFMTLIGTPAAFLPGVILFCLVQGIYALYLSPFVKWFLIRAGVFAVSVLGLKAAGMMDLKNVLGLLDISLLLINTGLAWTLARKKTSRLFKTGITLFLCCDCSIALRTLTSGSTHDIIDFLVWIFYVPSQAAICLSYIQEPKAFE